LTNNLSRFILQIVVIRGRLVARFVGPRRAGHFHPRPTQTAARDFGNQTAGSSTAGMLLS
jgi:hypothetical protein